MAGSESFDFISIATHQLRTPLTAMNGYLKMLGGGSYGEIPSQIQKPLQQVQEAADRMRDLVSTLSEINHIETGRTQPTFVKFGLNDLLAEATDFAVKHALDKQIQIKVPSSVEIEAKNDYQLCQQILRQYVRNAVLYSQPGQEVAITVDTEPQQTVVAVHDNGIGIPQAEQNQVFQGYFRASNVTTLDVGGNGLGLFLARKCADLTKLTVNFQSTENNGSVFRLIIPSNYAPA